MLGVLVERSRAMRIISGDRSSPMTRSDRAAGKLRDLIKFALDAFRWLIHG